jgi:hypothetical protein
VIWDKVKPGFFLPVGAGVPFDGDPGSPPGRAIPRFSARDGFLDPTPGLKLGTIGAECRFFKVGGPVGSLKPAGIPPGRPPGEGRATGLPGAKAPPAPTGPDGIWRGEELSEFIVGVAEAGVRPVGGMPWRPRWNAFIRACISDDTFRPLPLFENVGVGNGLLAALRVPRGVEEGVIPDTMADVDNDRGERAGGSSGASAAGSEAIGAYATGTSEGGELGVSGDSGVASFSMSGSVGVITGEGLSRVRREVLVRG